MAKQKTRNTKLGQKTKNIFKVTVLQNSVSSTKNRIRDLMTRRPHRSFRRTRRRDYTRSLRLPGYWALTVEVWQILQRRKYLFLLLGFSYALLSSLFVGLASQSTYDELNRSLTETGGELFEGNWGEIGKAGLLLVSGVTGSLGEVPTDVQRIFASLLGLLVWLTVVWLLRASLSGKRPSLRDGLYNASAPLISTFLVSLVLVVQLLPVAVGLIAFSAFNAAGLVGEGVESMLFWTVALLLATLSLYWLVSTFFALVVVTLPGMYPVRALRIAGDLVVGRRLRIMLRFVWLVFLLVILWAITMIPLILIDNWLKGAWEPLVGVPVVPVALLIVATFSLIWTSAYTYIFYRKVVDDDAAPA